MIEVLIAMVILAVGLLALQALGVAVAGSNVRAQYQSKYALVASDFMEQTVSRLRQPDARSLPVSALALDTVVGLPGSADSVQVSGRVSLDLTSIDRRRVWVTVRRVGAAGVRPDSVAYSTYVFIPAIAP